MALLTGCAQRALNTDINAATIRLLTRHGCEVVVAEGAGCCGALTHHMGKTRESHAAAAKNIRAWMREADGAGLDAVVVNTSGCGTTVKDYGHMFAGDPLAADAARVAGLARDVTELMAELGLGAGERAAAQGRLSRRLLAAARPADPRAAEGAAQGRGLRGGGAARQPPLLRLGRDLQPAAAGDLARSSGRARWRRWRSGRRR